MCMNQISSGDNYMGDDGQRFCSAYGKSLTLKKMQAKKCTLETATTSSLVILNIDAPRYTTA